MVNNNADQDTVNDENGDATHTEAGESGSSAVVQNNVADVNALRQDLFNLVSTQMESAVAEMHRQMADFMKSNTPEQSSSANRNNLQSAREGVNINEPTPVEQGNQMQMITRPPPTQVPAASYFRLPSLSASNLALIKAGKFINFDFLLPGSLAHTSSGYSVHFHSPANGVEGDTPFSLQPHAGRRTVKSFTSWLSAQNIFFQAFCYFFQHLQVVCKKGGQANKRCHASLKHLKKLLKFEAAP